MLSLGAMYAWGATKVGWVWLKGGLGVTSAHSPWCVRGSKQGTGQEISGPRGRCGGRDRGGTYQAKAQGRATTKHTFCMHPTTQASRDGPPVLSH